MFIFLLFDGEILYQSLHIFKKFLAFFLETRIIIEVFAGNNFLILDDNNLYQTHIFKVKFKGKI